MLVALILYIYYIYYNIYNIYIKYRVVFSGVRTQNADVVAWLRGCVYSGKNAPSDFTSDFSIFILFVLIFFVPLHCQNEDEIWTLQRGEYIFLVHEKNLSS